MASEQCSTLADRFNTLSTLSAGPSTLPGAIVQSAEGNKFSNTGRDTINLITVQNINIDHRNTVAPESEQASEGFIVEDNEGLQPVSDLGGNFGIYSTLSTVLAAIFGGRRSQNPISVGEQAYSDDSSPLPQDSLTNSALGHSFEPAATISDIPSHYSFLSSSSPSVITERYTRSMLDCQSTAGYPLYEPRPDSEPSTEYWKKGVRVGDVGIVTEDGIFDFLFNVCPSRNPSINPTELPDDFEPLVPCPEVRVMEQHFKMNTHLFSNKVNRIQEPDSRYKCLGPEGAILELPMGATLFEAKDKLSFKRLASRQAEEWYKYTICAHWGIAVFDRPSASQDYLQFIKNETSTITDQDLHSKYDWNGPGSFIGKVPRDLDIAGPRDGGGTNQCVFLRGYKIMLRKDLWDNTVNPHSSESPLITRPSLSHSPGSEKTRQGNSSNQNDLRREDYGGGSESDWGRSRQPARGTSAGGTEPMDVDPPFTTSSQMEERVIIQADFNVSPFHPSDIINVILLSQEPDAKIALTHDDDWWDLLRDDKDLAKIASSYTSVIDEYGSASLELQTRSEILSTSTSFTPPVPSGLESSITSTHFQAESQLIQGHENPAPSQSSGALLSTQDVRTPSAQLSEVLYQQSFSRRKKNVIFNLKTSVDLSEELELSYTTTMKNLLHNRCKNRAVPRYNLINRRGPDNDPIFEYEVQINETTWGKGSASNKEDAMEEAARMAVDYGDRTGKFKLL